MIDVRMTIIWSIVHVLIQLTVFDVAGAYLENLAERWMSGTVPDDAESCLAEITANEMRTDWWDPIDLTGKFDRVKGNSGFWAGNLLFSLR